MEGRGVKGGRVNEGKVREEEGLMIREKVGGEVWKEEGGV